MFKNLEELNKAYGIDNIKKGIKAISQKRKKETMSTISLTCMKTMVSLKPLAIPWIQKLLILLLLLEE